MQEVFDTGETIHIRTGRYILLLSPRSDMDQNSSYRESIQRAYPDFSVYSIKRNMDGQNNDTFIVNDTFIFRFPKYVDGRESLKRELFVLNEIGDSTTLPIPQVIFEHIEPQISSQTFVGYRCIPGVPLWHETLSNIDDEFIVARLAQQLAHFLKELHAVPTEAFREHQLPVADTYQEWKDVYARIQDTCYPHMRPDARLWATRHFETFLADPAHFGYKPVLKHGDFGPSNILFDLDKQDICGIIDFGGAGPGDPAYDFAGLLSGYGEAFLRRLVPLYPEIEDFWDRILFYRGTLALLEALFGIENQDQSAFQIGNLTADGMAWGWQLLGNVLGLGYFVTKVYLLSVVFIWIRATLPRLRADQLMQFAWLLLLPITLGTILVTGLFSLLASAFQLSMLPFLLSLGVLNWVALFGFLWLVGRVTRATTRKVQTPVFHALLRLKRLPARVNEGASQHGQEIIF